MSIPPAAIGKRIRDLRERSGFSQAYLARNLGISQPAVSQMEKGERAVTSTELYTLADLFGVSWNAFFEEAALDPRPLVAGLRGEPSEEAKRLIHWITYRLQVYDKLREKLDERFSGAYFAFRHSTAVPSYHIEDRDVGVLQAQALDAARERRGALGIGSAPVQDIWKLLDAENMFVVRYRSPDNAEEVSGMFLYQEEKKRAVLLVNEKESLERQRFTAVHEYGHFLDRSAASVYLRENGGLKVAVDKEQTVEQEKKKNPHERFADLFAISFLVPTDTLRLFVARLEPEKTRGISVETAVYAQAYFGVSRPCILWRLFNEGLITAKQRKEYEADTNRWNQMRNGISPSERHAQHTVLPDRFGEILLHAHAAGLLSRGKLMELLDADTETVDDLLLAFRNGEDADHRL